MWEEMPRERGRRSAGCCRHRTCVWDRRGARGEHIETRWESQEEAIHTPPKKTGAPINLDGRARGISPAHFYRAAVAPPVSMAAG